MIGGKIITKNYFLPLTFFTCFHSAYRGEQPPTILPPFYAIDSFRRNEISLVDFQHEKIQTSTIGNFQRNVDVQYQICEMPRSSYFWSMATMLCNRESTGPRHTANHDDHEKLNAWFSYFCACLTVMGLHSASLRATGELRYNLSLQLL